MATLSLWARLGIDGSGYFLGIKKAESAAKGLSKEFNSNVKGAIAGAFGVAALIAYEKSVIQFASHINDLSDDLGVSTDALQEWSYAAKQNGSDIDAVTGFFEKLGVARQKALGNNAESIAGFKKLGVTLDDLKKKRLEDIGLKIGRTVRDGDPQNLGGALREVGGRGAGKLVATFKADVESLSKAARDAGAVMGNDMIQRLDDLGDAFDNLAATLRGPAGAALLAVVDGLNMMATGVKAISAYFGQAAGKSPTLVGQIMNVGAAATPLGMLMKHFFPVVDASGKKEDQFEAFKKVFEDAAKQEVEGQQARAAKRNAKKLEIPTPSGVGHSGNPSVNSLQQIGAYIGGANPLLQTALKSEHHLETIKDTLLRKAISAKDTDGIFA